MTSTRRIAFATTVPIRSKTPSRAGTLRAVPVNRRAPKAPAVVSGTARRMIRGSASDLKKTVHERQRHGDRED
jgi:hypothetical protein